MTTYYQLFISPMANSDTDLFAFVAEFQDPELAGRYLNYMRRRRKYRQNDIIVIKSNTAEPNPNGFVDCICAVTGEFIVQGGIVRD